MRVEPFQGRKEQGEKELFVRVPLVTAQDLSLLNLKNWHWRYWDLKCLYMMHH